MLWTETKTAADAATRRTEMWGLRLQTDEDGRLVSRAGGEGLYEGGEFWAEAIKRVRHDPAQRLGIAKRHLPLPAAFREAAIALRAIIKERRKGGLAFAGKLHELHRLAAIGSLASYDALDITPFSEVQRLDLSPATLGWNMLSLLGVSERKLMGETWRAPARHVSAQELYPDVEASAIRRLERHRKEDAARRMKAIEEAFSRPEPEPVAKWTGFFSRLFGRG